MSTEPNSTRFGSGQAVRRLEDESLLAGTGRYADDLSLPGQAHLAFVRSPYPHAAIRSVDTDAAAAMPGVLRVITGADLVAAGVKPMPGAPAFKRADGADGATPPRRALAHGRARFVGEPVAAVIAETLQQARDAAEAVVVDYDDLPMVVDLKGATAEGAPLLCDEGTGNIAAEVRYGSADATAAAFAQASHVVKLDITNQRVAALTIEPRTVSVDYDASTGRLLIRMSTQMPSGVRDAVCNAIGLAKESVRVVVGDVGGGFGMKTGAYPEDIAVAYAAHALQRPVKWVADRSEEFVSSCHGRDVESHAELALDASGKILGLRVKSHANVGAYATGTGVAIQLLLGPWVQTSVYDIQTIDFHIKAVLTNTAPTGAYRGAGRPEAIFIIERLMDEAARQTGIDRVELRRRNFIQPEQMPYKIAMGQVYDTGAFESIMDQGLALADWSGFDARAAASAKQGKQRGLGIATFLEWTGGNVFEERVTVAIKAGTTPEDDGTIEIFTAVNAMGQGIATSLAQLAVDAFGVPIERVRIVLGDTDRGDGFGSAGSRSLFTGGSAVRIGAERTIDKARQLAAKEFEAAADDVVYANGVFTVAGTDLTLDLFALAGKQPESEIFMESTSAVAGPSWPNGCHICEVEIDPSTGEVAVVAYSSVNDVGRVVNPMIVRGQLEGGAVQGIGQALYEHMVYDVETGQPITGSLMDYAAPRADVLTSMFRMEMDESTPCKNNPLGVKGVGELGTIGATPAIVNAVADAFARNGLAKQTPHLQMPLSPARLWQAMQLPSN
ncbi:xanthine dehydrogenase family protein molybdopterin-binding subunit [Hydrogenophaga sp. PAMC20947]|uniref:xanthine dehydrogenase family protein molybdopterin-binding subunit n=1 Tax=Hydrogenophaga sp. PAMC20947 TaxID=2565558 RepID=UPI00109DD972|nr:xanthine dehydrogenase family protein molybdopterin-binding subunit [Hydrogenophaga sp. PAMC20947]QCB44944.1 xanthine dehydrogenase family protein molybdopterin-binding subunit [Hydrogenophaga sp. PAMC20947]